MFSHRPPQPSPTRAASKHTGSSRSFRHTTTTTTATAPTPHQSNERSYSRSSSSSSSSSSSITKPPSSRFSLDQFFRRMRTKSQDQDHADHHHHHPHHQNKIPANVTTTTKSSSSRPPSITTSKASHPVSLPSSTSTSSSSTSVRLCLSPGGRANVSLAIPVTPERKNAKPPQTQKQRPQSAAFLTLDESNGTAGNNNDDADGDDEDDNNRSSFSFGPWRDSVVLSSSTNDSVHSDVMLFAETEAKPATEVAPVPAAAAPTIQPPVISCSSPRMLLPDVRALCSISSSSSSSSLRLARHHIHQLQRKYIFEIRATKWAAYFLSLVRDATKRHRLHACDALSVRFAVVAYVRREAETRERLKQAQEKLFTHKMTAYRVAMQCICGTSVMKYGRKGKPHVTHLMIENGDTFKWTSSATILSSTKLTTKKSIPLAEIMDIRNGPTTDVLVKALQKGTLRLQDAKCTLSLITQKRTFDILAKNTGEREWLFKSLKFLVDLAKDHEKQIAQQAELAIMKKMETLAVWKHGRKGRPHKTRLFINRYGEISWQGRSGDTIQLEQIKTIELGHATSVFTRSRKAGLTNAKASSRCFSLVTRTRTLDIETTSEAQRDWYVVALRYLMDKVHEKTATMKREKAEKQLKVIHELTMGGNSSWTTSSSTTSCTTSTSYLSMSGNADGLSSTSCSSSSMGIRSGDIGIPTSSATPAAGLPARTY